MSYSRPLVSVILAVFNEEPYIEKSLGSLLRQSAPDFDLEVLVVDGNSQDGTAAKVSAIALSDPRVRLVVNERRKTPCAFNVGLRAARGEYVCILGAHTLYPQDYIAVCLRELKAHNAVGCSGQMRTVPANGSAQARLAAWTMGSRFASSRKSVRTQADGFADTIPYPVMLKQALLDVGGYDEELDRNQDNDMNHKLRSLGHRLYLTGKVESVYFARPTVRSLWEYAFLTGRWNAFTLRRNAGSMALRHFVPFAFVTVLSFLLYATVAAPLIAPRFAMVPVAALLLVLAAHLAVGFLAAGEVLFRERQAAALMLPPVIFAFHVAYGVGTFAGLLDLLTPAKRKAAERPRGMQTAVAQGTAKGPPVHFGDGAQPSHPAVRH